MDTLRLRAQGKINLGLDVTGIREDGYHEVRMVMQTVGLYDRIILEKTKEPGIVITANLPYVPTNENNLMYKAAKLLIDEFGITEGIRMDLNKFIPVAAGMAGGSTDAAAVLFGINKMFGLKLTRRQLMERGVTLGADVPYCIMRGTALAEGIGEELTRLRPMPDCGIVIAKPGVNVSTKLVYEKLDMDGVKKHPDIDAIIMALKDGDIGGIAANMGNVLEDVTIPMHPVIASIKEDMMARGAINAMMSGSGPTVFGIFTDMEAARDCVEFLRDKKESRQTYLTEPFNV
jgi:4-diphosphocytidyl-2-C-methyl-D-erythritol kinase